jgi:soluble lytic murein transglycosylase-like protein
MMDLRYYLKLLHSVLGVRPVREWPARMAFVFPVMLLVAALSLAAFRSPGQALGAFDPRTPTDRLIAKAGMVDRALRGVDEIYEDEVRPLEEVILRYRSDERLARRIATALVREGHRAGLAPDILLAVMLVENPWINPSARSSVGARGLMQVMPGHRGQWKACPKNNLEDIEANICYGAQIFKDYLRQTGNIETALLRYNGCVKGTNTPNCHLYPQQVFSRVAKRSSIQRPLHTHAD